MDNYHRFIKEPPIQVKENLVLYRTVLGPMIAGAISEVAQKSASSKPTSLEVSSMSLDFVSAWQQEANEQGIEEVQICSSEKEETKENEV